MQRLKRVGGQISQIPNGLRFRQPEINWNSKSVLGTHPSFESLVSAVISARSANPHHVAANNWALDRATVSNEVEAFNVRLCLSMGWTNFVADVGGGAPPPFSPPISPQDQGLLAAAAAKARKLWAGVKTVSEWLDSNAPAVSKELAEARAAICVACPYNGQGDLSQWFVVPAAAAIRRQLEKAQHRNLSTSYDDKLGICSQKDGGGGCLCANKLSVHIPIKLKLANMSEDVKRGMHASCWITREEKELS